MRRTIPLMLLLISCAAEDEECSNSRTGLYDVEFTRVDGDCGALPDAIMYLDRQNPFFDGPDCRQPPDGQTTNVLDGLCRYILRFDCEAQDESIEHWELDTTAWDEGDRADGTLMIEVESSDGERVCAGTYDVAAARR